MNRTSLALSMAATIALIDGSAPPSRETHVPLGARLLSREHKPARYALHPDLTKGEVKRLTGLTGKQIRRQEKRVLRQLREAAEQFALDMGDA